MKSWLSSIPGRSIARSDIPTLDFDSFSRDIATAIKGGARCHALFGHPDKSGVGRINILAVLSGQNAQEIITAQAPVCESFKAITPECPQLHLFEREIAEQWGLTPEGHPWLKPVRFSENVSADEKKLIPGNIDYYKISGDEIHEVAVGPVHAGIIEPGHFRFQCHGEKVFHLEISLGYQHRGIEKAFAAGPSPRTLQYAQTVAGDTTIGHTLAYSMAIETLTGISIPIECERVRGIALELERMANHTGDLGALAGDVGFLPTASYCGRLRGDLLNMTALICGSRFGRSLVRPGGTLFGLDEALRDQLIERLNATMTDIDSAVSLLFEAPSVLARFEGTGVLSADRAKELGLVGVAARACGLHVDVRNDYPFGIFARHPVDISTWPSGDVFARASVRRLELQQSRKMILDFARESLAQCDLQAVPAPAPNRMTVSLVEGWRGEICHVVATDESGKFAWYKIIDPSFHNWMGLAIAMRNRDISDFPLSNKSFNLSYCGHDL